MHGVKQVEHRENILRMSMETLKQENAAHLEELYAMLDNLIGKNQRNTELKELISKQREVNNLNFDRGKISKLAYLETELDLQKMELSITKDEFELYMVFVRLLSLTGQLDERIF